MQAGAGCAQASERDTRNTSREIFQAADLGSTAVFKDNRTEEENFVPLDFLA